uniref:DUF4378 domain-containing protein n=1 Tax=Ananas comosus var. bracteatus TaxID=296719 RepID=A0A6V7QFR8_ANACO|nr:unnamed protein product [Ananas comosus var. bracteatus]
MEGAIPLTHEIFQPGYRRPVHFSCSGAQELFSEGTIRPDLSDSFELALGPKPRGSREIAREITKQMRKTVHRGGAKKVSQILPHMDMIDNPDVFQRSSDLHDDWNPRLSPSSTYSSASLVSREARKRLSERWKMTHQFQDAKTVARDSSTLADMLALHDRDVQKAMKASNQTQASSAGPTSKDGWKDGNLIGSPISKSLPASSSSRRSPECRKRKESGRLRDYRVVENLPNINLDDFADGSFIKQGRSEIRSSMYRFDKACLGSTAEDEILLPEREIHVSSEELRKSIHVKNLSRQEFMHPTLSTDALREGDQQLVDISLVTECQDGTCMLTTQAKQVQQQLGSAIVVGDENIITSDLDGLVLEEEPVDHPLVDPILSPFKAPQPASPVSSNEGEPSPVSVLDTSLEEENSSSACFERISTDLQELRMQLQLLKLESADTYAEESELFIVSDEESVGESQPLCPTGEIIQTFRNEEERDFSYLLDMLIDLNAYLTNQDGQLSSCYSLDSPLGPGVFGKLEKKYSGLILWSRSERKLLFDLINTILADVVSSKLDLVSRGVSKWHAPKWDREGLVEEVWQRVVSRRRDIGCCKEGKVLELEWLDSEGGVEIVGRDMASMLCDELIEELIANFR